MRSTIYWRVLRSVYRQAHLRSVYRQWVAVTCTALVCTALALMDATPLPLRVVAVTILVGWVAGLVWAAFLTCRTSRD
jgi:hypothetical protein